MHTMILVREHEGLEEWVCSSCSRHMLVIWDPKFKRTVLDAGDSTAGHSGFKHKVQPAGNLDHNVDETPSRYVEIDESRLTPWVCWMDKTGFKGRWNDGLQ